MAKGNLFLGQASRKLGSVVFYKRNGNQVSRVWTDSGARRGTDASYAARAQRVRFGALSTIWRSFAFVSTRMYRSGKKVNESDYNYFARRNWSFMPYLTKKQNELGITMPVPGVYATGRLGEIYLSMTYVHDINNGTVDDLIYLRDKNRSFNGSVTWDQNPMDLLTALLQIYPSATKFVYLIGVIPGTNVVDGNSVYTNGSVNWYPVILDAALGADQFTGINYIRDLFSRNINNEDFQLFFANVQLDDIINGNTIFGLHINGDEEEYHPIKIMPLLFPVNDTASDCYSVALYPGNFPTSDGPFAFWAGYRTQQAFTAAAASYGYNKDVMQTQANIFGNDVIAWDAEYLNELAVFDPAIYEVYKTVQDADGGDVIAQPYCDVKRRYRELVGNDNQCDCDKDTSMTKKAKKSKKNHTDPSDDVIIV